MLWDFARKMKQDFGRSMAHGHTTYNLQLTGEIIDRGGWLAMFPNFDDVVANHP
jgi:hypothetical protein